MKRTYTATDLVQLPKLDASAAQSLCTEVLSTAKAILADKGAVKKIPESVIEAIEELTLALEVLNRAVATRLPVVATEETPRAKAADIVIDAIWSGLQSVLLGWSKIPGLPEAQVASSLHAMLFPTGLKFTQIAYKLEWAESNTRILLIKDRELEPQLKKLGAGKILERLHEAHREYGEALGITSPAEAVVENGGTVRDALDEVVDCLRMFVVRASGMISKKDPKRSELAEQLLAPVQSWQPPAARAKAAEAPAAPPNEAPAAQSPGGAQAPAEPIDP